MKHKLFISGYNESDQQLLVSFSSSETEREAKDYAPLAFDLAPYGDAPIKDILDMIANVAVSTCEDIATYESFQVDGERAEEIRSVVGKTFEYDDLCEPRDHRDTDVAISPAAQQAEEL